MTGAEPMAEGEPNSLKMIQDEWVDQPLPTYDPVIRLAMYCQMNECGRQLMTCTYKDFQSIHYYCPTCKHRVKIEVSAI